jgi:hypothetical protein
MTHGEDGSEARPIAARARMWLKRVLFPLFAVAIGLLVAFLLLEFALRVRPQIFSYRVQNLAFSKYDVLPDGVNVGVPFIRMQFMRSNFRTDFCFLGHCWEHVGDRWGFRNPPNTGQPELLLLGDSVIYGHGVEEHQTVAHFLRHEFGRPTYNMAKQGDCLYDHYVRFRMYVEELRPQTVLLFVFINDFQDLETRRRPAERPGFPEIDDYDYGEIRDRVAARQAQRPPWLSRALFRLHSIRLLVQTYRHLDRILAKIELTRSAEADDGSDPYFLAPVVDPERFRPLVKYYDRVLPDLDRRCRDLDARLVVVNLELYKPRRSERYRVAQQVVAEMLQSVCARHDIALADTGALFGEDWEEAYLVRDGHLSEYGHRQLAGFLEREVLAQEEFVADAGD